MLARLNTLQTYALSSFMAQIINRSSCQIEVYGTAFGGDSHWIMPGRTHQIEWVTDPSFNCIALRGFDGVDIFGRSDWFKIDTPEVHIYDWEAKDVSLHCIPFLSGGIGQPFLPGYQILPNPGSVITAPLDPDIELIQIAPAPADNDGEINHPHFLFGRYARTGDFISVRLRAVRDAEVARSDFILQQAIWKRRIEAVWNDPSVPDAQSGAHLQFELDWTTDDSARRPHYSISVSRSVPFEIFGNRNSMFLWSMDMDDDIRPQQSAQVDVLNVSPHEFGHFLGFTDGYLYDGEIPWLRELVKNQPSLKNAATDVGFFGDIAARTPICRERAQERIANGPETGPIDIMSQSDFWDRSGNHTANGRISQNMIEALENRKTQKLYWRPELFRRKSP